MSLSGQFYGLVALAGESTNGTHLNRICGEPESRSEQFGEERNFLSLLEITVGRDSSVGIAIRYGLEGLGIESRWEARFSAPVQTGPGAHPTSYTMGTGSLSRG